MKEEVYVDKLRYEKEFLNKGYNLIAGVDEVGRGPLAGPVVCCAVIMPLDDNLLIDGVDDSKKISEKNLQNILTKYPKLCYTVTRLGRTNSFFNPWVSKH